MAILEVHNLEKVYTTRFGGNQVRALRNVSLTVENGEYVAIGRVWLGKNNTFNVLQRWISRPTVIAIWTESLCPK